MKQHLAKLQIDGEANMKSRLHARALSTVASLRITLLALACAATAGTCLAAEKIPQPTAQSFSVVVGANLSNPGRSNVG